MKTHTIVLISVIATVFITLFGIRVNNWHAKSIVLDCTLVATSQEQYKSCFK